MSLGTEGQRAAGTSEKDDGGEGDDDALCGGHNESENQVAHDHEYGSEDEHGSSLALTVEEVAEERCYGCCTKREHEEHLSCLLGCEVEVALEHVDSVLLEREDG